MFKPVQKPEEMPILVLAYIGDAVFDLFIRQCLVGLGITRLNQLHQNTVMYVRADSQAVAMRGIEGKLNEKEAAVARRGRNAKSGHPRRGIDINSYRHSTGIEALIGFLYLKGEFDRLEEILNLALQTIEEATGHKAGEY